MYRVSCLNQDSQKTSSIFVGLYAIIVYLSRGLARIDVPSPLPILLVFQTLRHLSFSHKKSSLPLWIPPKLALNHKCWA